MTQSSSYEDIHRIVTGDSGRGPLGLQDDWWTCFAPVFENAETKGSRLHVYDHTATDPSKKYRTVLDFCTFFATSPIAYNHPNLKTSEFREKMANVAVNKPSNSDFWTIELADFISTFHEVAGREYLPHMFIISGGALAFLGTAIGLKKTPGPLYGITKHLWPALAVAVVAWDRQSKGTLP